MASRTILASTSKPKGAKQWGNGSLEHGQRADDEIAHADRRVGAPNCR